MHGHCDHTGKISSTADSQNTQHFRFLHFESHAAFCSGSFLSYKPHYTRFCGRFNHFVQSSVSRFVCFAQPVYRFMNCKPHFLQFILHFRLCIAPCPGLQESHDAPKKGVCSASFPSSSSKRAAVLAGRPAIFTPIPSFFAARPRKNRRKPSRSFRRSVWIALKFVKPAAFLCAKQQPAAAALSQTTISYSPMPPEAK